MIAQQQSRINRSFASAQARYDNMTPDDDEQDDDDNAVEDCKDCKRKICSECPYN